MLGIFCHIGNYDVWLKMIPFIKKINIEYEVYINILKDLDEEQKNLIKNNKEFDYKHIFELPNKGCDIGPFVYFMNHLRENNIKYDYIINFHTKTDDDWREAMLKFLVTDTKRLIKMMEEDSKYIAGIYQCPYDYYNYYYDIEMLDKLKIPYIKNWDIFLEKTGIEADNLQKLLVYLNQNPLHFRYVPDFFEDIYKKIMRVEYKDGKIHNVDSANDVLYQMLLNMDAFHKLYYYPGTTCIFNHNKFEEVFSNGNLMEIYNEFEEGKDDNVNVQNRTYSFERVFHMAFILYDLYNGNFISALKDIFKKKESNKPNIIKKKYEFIQSKKREQIMEQYTYFMYKNKGYINELVMPNLLENSKNCLVIMCTHKSIYYMDYTIRYSLSNLKSDFWRVIVYCAPKDFDKINEIIQKIDNKIKLIPLKIKFEMNNDVNELLLDCTFYEKLKEEGIEKILYMDGQSLVYNNGVEEFMEYDWIGGNFEANHILTEFRVQADGVNVMNVDKCIEYAKSYDNNMNLLLMNPKIKREYEWQKANKDIGKLPYNMYLSIMFDKDMNSKNGYDKCQEFSCNYVEGDSKCLNLLLAYMFEKYLKMEFKLKKFNIPNQEIVYDNNHKENFRKFCKSNIELSRYYNIPNFKEQSDNCAVFIDFRMLDHIEFVLRKTYYHLTNAWSAMIICGEDNYDYMKELANKIHPNINVKKYKNNVKSVEDYNNMMYDIYFWNMINAKKCLIFQEDSLLLRDGVEKFLRYDYIGAPWPIKDNISDSHIGNGGFSIRNVDLMKKIFSENTQEQCRRKEERIIIDGKIPEDVFISRNIDKYSNDLPSLYEATEFACENHKYENSYGMHNIWCINYDYLTILNDNVRKVKLNNMEFNLINNHRSGWKYVQYLLNNIKNNNSKIICDENIERTFIWNNNIEYNKDWIGFSHLTPNNIPFYMDKLCNITNIFKNKKFIDSLPYCRGLFVFSNYMKRYFERELKKYYDGNIIIEVLYHPSENVDNKFTWDKYIQNNNKNIIQLGSQLRKITSIYLLKTKYNKLWFSGRNYNESMYLLNNDIAYNNLEININDVEMKMVNDNEYDEYLSKNICFIDLYDASCNNSIIECIIRNTPIIVNKLEPVIEYLGEYYPLYYNNLEEASRLINDNDKLYEGYKYLCENQYLKNRLMKDYFMRGIVNSNIYRNIGIKKTNKLEIFGIDDIDTINRIKKYYKKIFIKNDILEYDIKINGNYFLLTSNINEIKTYLNNLDNTILYVQNEIVCIINEYNKNKVSIQTNTFEKYSDNINYYYNLYNIDKFTRDYSRIKYINNNDDNNNIINKYFTNIFLIHLKNDYKREKNIEIINKELINYNMVTAISYKEDTKILNYCDYLIYRLYYDLNIYTINKKKSFTYGAICINLSSQLIFNYSIEKELENILVFEDDIYIHKKYNELFDVYMNNMNNNWDILFFGVKQNQNKPCTRYNDYWSYINSKTYGMHSIAYSYKNIKNINELFQEFKAPIDCIVNEITNMNIYKTNENIFITQCGETNIAINIETYEQWNWNINNYIINKNIICKNNTEYICNITGNKFILSDNEKTREGGNKFGYNCRFRAICYILTKLLFNQVKILYDLDINKNIKGIGMSDSGWANICEKKFNYINTFYHKQPYLDIYNTEHVKNYSELDFIISSDVFEHIDPNPGIQIAFDNLYKMLKKNGFIVFSVPFTDGEHIEHYPNLYKYNIIKENNNYILYNMTKEGINERFENLCFHGGPGNVLEMRIFSKKSIISYLEKSGFTDIVFHNITDDMNNYGIFWSLNNDDNNSVIITARK